MQKLSYEEVITTIENKRRFGNLKGVEISEVMLEKLGNPQKDLPFIHIAGTNGKGSVSAFLRSVLKNAGLKTGMFTSPHLVDFRERIQINDEMISKEAVERLGNELLETDFGVYPTMFDYCLAMALLYFKEQQCDVIILETGLGGRYDSTNACGVPDVTVITKIGYDHMAILGNTLQEIASEKAGIIKKGTELVLESQEEEAMQVLISQAKSVGIEKPLVVDKDKIEICKVEDGMQKFSYGKLKSVSMRMLGVHQYENAAAAILAAEAFYEKRISKKLEEEERQNGIVMECIREKWLSAVRGGIEETQWEGRMELVCKNPFFLMDGAHNSNGVNALKESLESLYPGEKFHFIMGVMADKDYEQMIEKLLPLALDFKTVTVESERALQAEQLADCIREKGIAASVCPNVKDALPDFSVVSEEKTIAFGSLYFIGEIKQLLQLEKQAK